MRHVLRCDLHVTELHAVTCMEKTPWFCVHLNSDAPLFPRPKSSLHWRTVGPKAFFPKRSSSRADTFLHAAMLNVYDHVRAPSHCPTRGNMAVSAQAALFQAAARKLLSASCCTQVARHLSSSCSAHVALCKILSAKRSALVSVRKMLRLS